ncbi:site-specific DNA-methyltransferase [Microbaculum sp. FT89]|uniref:site-specific DNA-methyltransferase n=1 Tax=Microbaculum sp. FT89 TaxID=3447298 RepID=UPI003F538C13
MSPSLSKVGIESVSVSDLKPNARNARTHTRKQLKQIASSIERFGFVNPVLVDSDGGIIAGHGRVEAAKLLCLEEVPVLRIEHLNETEKRAYVIADNRLAELAGWDRDLLAIELGELIEFEFDVELTGFSIAETDVLIEEHEAKAGEPDPDDEAPEAELNRPAVTQTGDVWQLGDHRLVCGDARDESAYEALLTSAEVDGQGREKARLVFTDPPYNVRIENNVSGLGKIRHGEFAMASGEMSKAEFTGFLATVFDRLAGHSLDGSIHFVCMDWRHLAEALAAGEAVYPELKNLIVWVKPNGGMGTFYRSRHELVLAFKSGTAPHINSFELGQTGRYRTNVWEYAGANSFHAERLEELAMHPTVKPVALVADAIRDCSKRRDIVLDPFGGSGSTLIAAERTGRRARLVEIDPHYCDVIIRRWQTLTGKAAVHAATGAPFEAREEEHLTEDATAGPETGEGDREPTPADRAVAAAGCLSTAAESRTGSTALANDANVKE